jgi:hypothetical protein
MWRNRENETLCVAMGSWGGPDSESCTAMLYDDGSFAWTAGMPTGLHNKLNGKGSYKHPYTTYLAMGTWGRAYVVFADGTTQWWGATDVMAESFRHSSVKTVAFGEDMEDYFILYNGGGYAYRGIPPMMERDAFSNKYKKKTFAAVALGPKGEWWARWTDGSSKWGNTTDVFDTKCQSMNARSVMFGPDGDFFIRGV